MVGTAPELPPPGRWALGRAGKPLAERLLARAQAQSLRTAWLGPEAGFISNLDMQENLRLMHDWHDADAGAFARHLQSALAILQLAPPAWLPWRPAQLGEAALAQARWLRVLLLRPEVLVLHPALLDAASDVWLDALQTEASRFLLLDDASVRWSAWPPPDIIPGTAGDTLSP